jgi:hypothetical protein
MFVRDIGKISKDAAYEGLIGAIVGGGISTAGNAKGLTEDLKLFVSPEQRELNKKFEGDKYKLAEKIIKQEKLSPKEEQYVEEAGGRLQEMKDAIGNFSFRDFYDKQILGIKDRETLLQKEPDVQAKPKEGFLTPEEQDYLDRVKKSDDIEGSFLWSMWRNLGDFVSPTMEVGPGAGKKTDLDNFFDFDSATQYLKTFESGNRDITISRKIANDEELTVEEQSYLQDFEKKALSSKDKKVRERFMDLITGSLHPEDKKTTGTSVEWDEKTDWRNNPFHTPVDKEQTTINVDENIEPDKVRTKNQQEIDEIFAREERKDRISELRERRSEKKLRDYTAEAIKAYNDNPDSVEPEIRIILDEFKQTVGEDVDIETAIETPDQERLREQMEQEAAPLEEPVVEILYPL